LPFLNLSFAYYVIARSAARGSLFVFFLHFAELRQREKEKISHRYNIKMSNRCQFFEKKAVQSTEKIRFSKKWNGRSQDAALLFLVMVHARFASA
jgi:hypothetical protein